MTASPQIETSIALAPVLLNYLVCVQLHVLTLNQYITVTHALADKGKQSYKHCEIGSVRLSFRLQMRKQMLQVREMKESLQDASNHAVTIFICIAIILWQGMICSRVENLNSIKSFRRVYQ